RATRDWRRTRGACRLRVHASPLLEGLVALVLLALLGAHRAALLAAHVTRRALACRTVPAPGGVFRGFEVAALLGGALGGGGGGRRGVGAGPCGRGGGRHRAPRRGVLGLLVRVHAPHLHVGR